MKEIKSIEPVVQHVVVNAKCPYCGYNCFYEFTEEMDGHLADDFDADVCDHCVDYGAYEFIFEREVNGLQKLQELSEDDKKDT